MIKSSLAHREKPDDIPPKISFDLIYFAGNDILIRIDRGSHDLFHGLKALNLSVRNDQIHQVKVIRFPRFARSALVFLAYDFQLKHYLPPVASFPGCTPVVPPTFSSMSHSMPYLPL